MDSNRSAEDDPLGVEQGGGHRLPANAARAQIGLTQTSSTKTPPTEPTPSDTAPIATAPIATAPIATAPIDTAPIDTTPIDTAPIDTAPIDTAPIDTTTERVPVDAERHSAPVQPPSSGAHTPERDWASGSVGVLTRAEAGPPRSATTSRAGRNLPAAIGVSLGLGAVIIASLLLYRPSFVAVVCIAVAYATYEMVRAIGAAEARPPLVPLVVGGVAMDAAAWYGGANALVLGLLLTVLGVTLWRLAGGALGYARDVTSAAFIVLYVPLLGGFAVLLTHYSDGTGRVIAFIATVACSDVGGYTAGVLFGKHPMAPTVSPKKSWEGFIGSVLACSLGGALFLDLLFHHRWWVGVLYGLAIAVTATIGDLGESMVKRDLGVKDMGRLLPGHGGLMDRLDSLLPCAAVTYLILAVALN